MYIYTKRKTSDKKRNRSNRFRAKLKAKARRRFNRMDGRRLSARRASKNKR